MPIQAIGLSKSSTCDLDDSETNLLGFESKSQISLLKSELFFS